MPRMNDLCANCGKRLGDHHKDDVEPGNPIPALACPDGSPAGYNYSIVFKAKTSQIVTSCPVCHGQTRTPACERCGGRGVLPATEEETPSITRLLERARESQRLAEIDLRAALGAATSAGPLWLCLYEQVETVANSTVRIDTIARHWSEQEKGREAILMAANACAHMENGMHANEIDWPRLKTQLLIAGGKGGDQ